MQPVYDDDLGDAWKWQFERRYSDRIREKRQRKVLTRMSLTYELTYTDRDIENIPLICFLTDRRLRLYMKRLSASSLISKTGEKSDEDANNAAVPTDRDVEETSVSEENIAQETSNCCGLPVKKLLLNRFRGNVSRKFQIPFRQQNNNYPGQVNFAEATATESVSVRQNWSANRKRGSNKENVSTFAFSFEQQLHVDLDTGITGPVVTELHRDFLAAIDFDKYKIF
ncbi:uncharacterized protein LOC117218841 [Megalopta genalis]|uniref:uncharacterized protein LOC117218841 n=1 Tax=Megalopta genalis TaxID=115081 RepID=UPI003FD19F7D